MLSSLADGLVILFLVLTFILTMNLSDQESQAIVNDRREEYIDLVNKAYWYD